jgi:hypothetical protein
MTAPEARPMDSRWNRNKNSPNLDGTDGYVGTLPEMLRYVCTYSTYCNWTLVALQLLPKRLRYYLPLSAG